MHEGVLQGLHHRIVVNFKCKTLHAEVGIKVVLMVGVYHNLGLCCHSSLASEVGRS